MKLSEAILKGCEIAPHQAQGAYWNSDKQHACALGAAILAFNPKMSLADAIRRVEGMWPVLETQASEWNLPELHPTDEAPPGGHTLFSWITMANDTLDWSRETIAQVLEEHGL